MLFAQLQRILKLELLHLRGLNGVKDEFHLATANQNLRGLVKMKRILRHAPAERPSHLSISIRSARLSKTAENSTTE